MRIQSRFWAVLLALCAITLGGCNGGGGDSDTAEHPFSNGSAERNLVVVISDIHLGANLAYAECNKNRAQLENMLKEIGKSANVKELVIAGDLFDEWFVPAKVDTYQGSDQANFITRMAEANAGVFDALKAIINAGNITVTYVPGNHDLTISEANVALVLPGIKQARDTGKLGLGTYSPVDFPQLAIEHGHRCNFFCAPDPISNQTVAPGTILPPGYFFTRLAALYVVEGRPAPGDVIPLVTKNTSDTASASQDLLYGYWGSWAWSLREFPITEKFSDDIFVTNINGFTDTYSVNDFLPYQTVVDGTIDVNLFKGIQDTWGERQTKNNVPVAIPTAHAIEYVATAEETDYQAQNQYFLNPKANKRIVVFGHTHAPKIITSASFFGKKTIYANSGTWIDHNGDLTTMNFIVITPQRSDPASETTVALYNYQNHVVTKMDQASVHL
jgi:UDP-2,3-diacylglucosamine pyrophosphatase LpxH